MSQIEKKPMGQNPLRSRLYSAINKYAENYSKTLDETHRELSTTLDELDMPSFRSRLHAAIEKYAENYSKDKIHDESLLGLCTVLDELDVLLLVRANLKNPPSEV